MHLSSWSLLSPVTKTYSFVSAFQLPLEAKSTILQRQRLAGSPPVINYTAAFREGIQAIVSQSLLFFTQHQHHTCPCLWGPNYKPYKGSCSHWNKSAVLCFYNLLHNLVTCMFQITTELWKSDALIQFQKSFFVLVFGHKGCGNLSSSRSWTCNLAPTFREANAFWTSEKY